MINIIKHRLIEIIGVLINIILISKYLFDKITIRCEPCLDPGNCSPCQTKYMKYFWIYMIGFNIMFIVALVIKRRIGRIERAKS